MSLRRLSALIHALPPDSATAMAVDGLSAEQRAWGTTDYLLALVFDAVQAGNWQFARAHSKSSPPRPKPLPRPQQVQREVETVSGWQGRTVYTEE